MAKISSNKQSFFQMMGENTKQEQYGVQLLLQQTPPAFEENLNYLIQFGLFDPARSSRSGGRQDRSLCPYPILAGTRLPEGGGQGGGCQQQRPPSTALSLRGSHCDPE